jgi:hypothetical protein
VQDDRITIAADGPAECAIASSCEYQFAVNNDATGREDPVSVTVQLPKNLAFVQAEPEGTYDPKAHTVTWEPGVLNEGEDCAVHITCTAREAGPSEGKILVKAGKVGQKQVSWVTKVIPAPQTNLPTALDHH